MPDYSYLIVGDERTIYFRTLDDYERVRKLAERGDRYLDPDAPRQDVVCRSGAGNPLGEPYLGGRLSIQRDTCA